MRRAFACLAVAALVGAGIAHGAKPPPTYRVTVTATQTSTLSCYSSAQTSGTVAASIVSTAPITAVVRGASVRFSPSSEIPLRVTATIDFAACGPPAVTPARSCGTVTAAMHPGGFLQFEHGELRFSYDSNTRLFPAPDSCSSGILELGATAALDAVTLARSKRFTVRGSVVKDEEFGAGTTAGIQLVHREMQFVARFARLP